MHPSFRSSCPAAFWPHSWLTASSPGLRPPALQHDIPELVAAAAAAHPGVECVIAEPIGIDSLMAQLIENRVAAAEVAAAATAGAGAAAAQATAAH